VTRLDLQNGVFGTRMKDVAGRLGAVVDSLDYEWGTPVVPEDVRAKLETESYQMVGVVHAETSTGVRNPIEEIAELVRPSGALFLLDSVTGLGGIPVELDRWGLIFFTVAPRNASPARPETVNRCLEALKASM